MKSMQKMAVALGLAGLGATAFAVNYTWDSANLTGNYLSPTSWGLEESATFSPASTDNLYFNTSGLVYQPSFESGAGQVDIYGQWQIQNGSTLRLAIPDGTILMLSGDNVGTGWSLSRSTLDISQGEVKIGTPPSSQVPYGRAYVSTGSRFYVHGEGTSLLGISDSSVKLVQPVLISIRGGRTIFGCASTMVRSSPTSGSVLATMGRTVSLNSQERRRLRVPLISQEVTISLRHLAISRMA